MLLVPAIHTDDEFGSPTHSFNGVMRSTRDQKETLTPYAGDFEGANWMLTTGLLGNGWMASSISAF